MLSLLYTQTYTLGQAFSPNRAIAPIDQEALLSEEARRRPQLVKILSFSRREKKCLLGVELTLRLKAQKVPKDEVSTSYYFYRLFIPFLSNRIKHVNEIQHNDYLIKLRYSFSAPGYNLIKNCLELSGTEEIVRNY